MLGIETQDFTFNFKWSDNMQVDGDIMDFYSNGDVAPAGRFMYHYDTTSTGIAPDFAGNGSMGKILIPIIVCVTSVIMGITIVLIKKGKKR